MKHPGKEKPWKFCSGTKSGEAQIGDHEECEMFVTNLGTRSEINPALGVLLCDQPKTISPFSPFGESSGDTT